MPSDPRTVVLGFIRDVVNGGNLDLLATYVSPSYTDQTNNPGQVLGVQGLRQQLLTTRGRLNGFTLSVDASILEGNGIALRETAVFTPQGGAQMRLAGIDIFTVSNGLITERWGTW